MSDPPAAPLFQQISDSLVRQIASGELVEGERLPPERVLAARHRVAVGTVRRALAELQAQGLVDRRQGSGNYVRGVREVGGLYGFFRLELADGPGRPRADLLGLDQLDKPAEAPRFGDCARAHRLRRLRLLDDLPAAVEEIWLDAGTVPVLRAEDLSASLYGSYLTRFGLRIARIEDRIGVGQLPDWGAGPLNLPSGHPVGHVERLAWSQSGQRVEFSRTWFDPARVRFVSRTV